MEEKYNCFKCDGYNTICPTYFGIKPPKCMYKAVAENDMGKFREGRTDLTLIDMLEEHLEIKIDVKEIKKDSGNFFNKVSPPKEKHKGTFWE